jgi:RNA polymerase sigma-70 factor (ECF subfamily)
VDIIRREARRAGKETEAMMFADPAPVPGPAEPPEVIRDDLLRLVFTCCHPALNLEAQVALALRTLGGLSTAEVARSLLVPEATMAKRLSRAKQKIAQAGIPYRVPATVELPGRLAGVAATVYLIFNEGYAAGTGADLVRITLTGEAIRLARLLAGLMPDEPTVLGLLALLVLTDARRAARADRDGRPVLLADQDRGLWDAEAIREGVELVGRALRRTPDRPDQYVVQAAIAACHALAPSYPKTNWDAVISW